MAFRFSLEPVRKHRKRQEELAKRDLMEAQAKVQRVLEEIEAMYNRADEVRREIFMAQGRGLAKDIELVRQMEFFLIGHRVRIKKKREVARELMMSEEAYLEKLVEASKDRKAMEKLREKRLSEYKIKMAKLEAKELDDISTMRHSRRLR